MVICCLLFVVCWWLFVGVWWLVVDAWGTGNGERLSGNGESEKLKVKSCRGEWPESPYKSRRGVLAKHNPSGYMARKPVQKKYHYSLFTIDYSLFPLSCCCWLLVVGLLEFLLLDRRRSPQPP